MGNNERCERFELGEQREEVGRVEKRVESIGASEVIYLCEENE